MHTLIWTVICLHWVMDSCTTQELNWVSFSHEQCCFCLELLLQTCVIHARIFFICLLLRLLSGWVWGPSGVWYYHLQTQNYPFLTQVEGKTTMYCHFSIIGSPWQILCHHGLQRWHFLKAFSYFLFLKRLAVDFKSSNALKGVFCLWVSTAFVPFCSFKKHFFINWYIEMIRHLSKQLCNISNSIE